MCHNFFKLLSVNVVCDIRVSSDLVFIRVIATFVLLYKSFASVNLCSCLTLKIVLTCTVFVGEMLVLKSINKLLDNQVDTQNENLKI